MHSVLRLALCGEINKSVDITGLQHPDKEVNQNNETNNIVMTGPLSEVYTKALEIVYAKDNEESGIMAVESQVNDAFMQIALMKAKAFKDINDSRVPLNILTPEEMTTGGSTYVYSTNAIGLNSNTIVNVVGALAQTSQANTEGRTVLIVDGGESSGTEFNTLQNEEDAIMLPTLKAATERLCKSVGVEVFYSLESFMETLRKN